MSHPVMAFDVNSVNKQINYVGKVTALPDGTTLIYNRTSDDQRQVLRIDQEGQTVPSVHVCKHNSDSCTPRVSSTSYI